jgi:hypothetical protein
MALHAASRGRYDEASDWFQVSVLSGQSGVPPTAWSLEALYRWDGKRLFLDGLAKEKAL